MNDRVLWRTTFECEHGVLVHAMLDRWTWFGDDGDEEVIIGRGAQEARRKAEIFIRRAKVLAKRQARIDAEVAGMERAARALENYRRRGDER